jgi:hypothetical protein
MNRLRFVRGLWIVLLCGFAPFQQGKAQFLVDFNATSDLATDFTPGSAPVFTNSVSGGLNSSGAVDIPSGASDLWTCKTDVAAGGTGSTYTVSIFFYNVENAGYAGIGFATAGACRRRDVRQQHGDL